MPFSVTISRSSGSSFFLLRKFSFHFHINCLLQGIKWANIYSIWVIALSLTNWNLMKMKTLEFNFSQNYNFCFCSEELLDFSNRLLVRSVEDWTQQYRSPLYIRNIPWLFSWNEISQLQPLCTSKMWSAQSPPKIHKKNGKFRNGKITLHCIQNNMCLRHVPAYIECSKYKWIIKQYRVWPVHAYGNVIVESINFNFGSGIYSMCIFRALALDTCIKRCKFINRKFCMQYVGRWERHITRFGSCF